MKRRSNTASYEEAKISSRRQRAKNSSANRDGRHSDGSQNSTSAQRRSRRSPQAEERDAKRSRSAKQPEQQKAASSRAAKSSRSRAEAPAAENASAASRESRRRNKSKRRAEKLFDRQYAPKTAAADAQETDEAPRAALYEGRMGASQRKATRMQHASEAEPASAKVNPAGWFSRLDLSARSIRTVTALLCIVLVGVFLYVPAQQYYQSVREHDRLAAEYASIEQRNDVLDEQNDALASNAGMEDAVRQKYGYVVKGDQAMIVTGLSEEATDTSRDGDAIEANVLASSVKAPEEWYTPYLDAFFGVS